MNDTKPNLYPGIFANLFKEDVFSNKIDNPLKIKQFEVEQSTPLSDNSKKWIHANCNLAI
jgi:hypothetical protein